MDILGEIPLRWVQLRPRTYVGLLGEHELAYVLQHDGETDWKWLISTCNGGGCTVFQSAETLETAQAAVQSGIETWFRLAGLLCEQSAYTPAAE